jgi:chromosome segregation ATPase
MTTMTENLISRFLSSPEGQRLRKEQLAQDLIACRALAAQLSDARDQLKRELPPLEKDAAATRNTVDQIQRDLEAAQTKANAAHRKVGDLTFSIELRIAGLEAELRRSSDPQIEAFHDELEKQWERMRQDFSVQESPPHWLTGRITTASLSSEVVHALLDTIKAARVAVEALKLEVLSKEEVAARLAVIQATVEAAADQQ